MIPKEYAGIIKTWYGPDQAWDRHAAPSSKEVMMKWFKKDDVFDKELTDMFKTDIEELAKGNKEDMRKNHYGALAYFLLGDQFARNVFRNKKEAFSCAEKCESLAKEILADRERYDKYRNYEKTFILMAMMHAENAADIQRCKDEFEIIAKTNPDQKGFGMFVNFSQKHLDQVVQFGRYP